MKLTFDTHDNEKQKDAVRAWINPNITEVDYGGGKGGGKTYLGCKLIFGDALMYPKTRYFIARKGLNDLRKYTLSSVQECFETWGLDPKKYYTFNGQDNYFTLHNGSQVYFLQAKYIPSDPEYYRFGSMQFTRGWIEEAGELESAAKNNLQAAVGRWMNKEYNLAPKLLQTFNPSKNYLYKRYKESKAGLLPSHVVYIQALLDDNKMLSPEYKKNLLRSLTKAQIERLVYGNMEYDDDPTAMMDYDAICDLFTNEIEKGGNKCISADLAMKGRDKFIAGAAEGYVMTIEIDKAFSPAKMIEEDLRGLMKKTSTGRSQLIADSDGLGQFIGSYLEGINEFHGGARAYASDKYFNLRSECYYKLAELVNARKIRVVCTEDQQERIKDELGVIKASNIEDPEKKLRVISKEDMSELLGHSPDYADMLMMWMVRFVSDQLMNQSELHIISESVDPKEAVYRYAILLATDTIYMPIVYVYDGRYVVVNAVVSDSGIDSFADTCVSLCRDYFIDDLYIYGNEQGCNLAKKIKGSLPKEVSIKAFDEKFTDQNIFSNYEFVRDSMEFSEANDSDMMARFIQVMTMYSKGDTTHKADAIDVICTAANVIKIKYRKSLY